MHVNKSGTIKPGLINDLQNELREVQEHSEAIFILSDKLYILLLTLL